MDNNTKIKWPVDIDSMGKLREAIDECGVPQRDTALEGPDVACWTKATIISFGIPISRNDREASNNAHRVLVWFFSGTIYSVMATMLNGQRLVWRTRPEIEESETNNFSTKFFIFNSIKPDDKIASVYCRYWIEDI